MYEDAGWVTQFYNAVKDYILIREEDRTDTAAKQGLQANSTAYRLLEYPDAGGDIAKLPA